MEHDQAEAIPDAADEAALRRARAVATILDESIRVPGTNYRIGIDPLLSALPSPAGDAVGAGLSLYIVLEAANLGVPYATVVRMLANVGVDAAVGSVPVVGALFDAVWKANRRNVALIERHLEARARRAGTDGSSGSDGEPVTIEVESRE